MARVMEAPSPPASPMISIASAWRWTTWPFTPRMTSPTLTDSRAAPLPASTSLTTTPSPPMTPASLAAAAAAAALAASTLRIVMPMSPLASVTERVKRCGSLSISSRETPKRSSPSTTWKARWCVSTGLPWTVSIRSPTHSPARAATPSASTFCTTACVGTSSVFVTVSPKPPVPPSAPSVGWRMLIVRLTRSGARSISVAAFSFT